MKDTLLKSDNKSRALKQLSNSCRLLTDLHFSFTKDRIKLVVPSLEKNIVHVIHEPSVMKHYLATHQTPLRNRRLAVLPSRETGQDLLVTRQSGGGGGGPQRPASRVNRRSYPSTSSQTAPKNFSHPKTRANVQH
ncbi:hypothetical protein ACJJTC_016856 [Scirpophaga incertulas]